MKTIPLNKGLVVMVDDEDYGRLSQWRWHAHAGRNTLYALRKGGVRMHREIMNAPEGLQVDHINHDGLNSEQEAKTAYDKAAARLFGEFACA